MCQGSREALERYKLTKRPYLGTTSMDTELAFLMASQAQVMVGPDVCLLVLHGPNPMLILMCADTLQARPGAIILDPFVGTGNSCSKQVLLDVCATLTAFARLSCAHKGAFWCR